MGQPLPARWQHAVVGRDFLNFPRAGGMDARSEPVLRPAPLQGRARGPAGRRLSRPELVVSAERHARRRVVRPPALPRGAPLLDRAGPRSLSRVVRRYATDRRLLAAIALSPAAVFCLISGQSSLVTAAMLLTIFACLDRKPMLAGILLGLLDAQAPAWPAVPGHARGFRPLARFSGGKRDGPPDCRRDGRALRPAGVARLRAERHPGPEF